MALGIKYRCEWTDDLGSYWRVDFLFDPDPGVITKLQASGEPLFIEWLGEDDNLDQHIMGSKMTLNVEAGKDFELIDLFTAANLSIKALVYHDQELFWSGYVLANNYQEPYDSPTFTVSIVATDGLGLLKDFLFSDLGYSTRQTKAKIVYDILETVGITKFTEYVNLYETAMSDDQGDSAFDQSGLDPDLFEDKTLYEALDLILTSLNAGIRQNKGVFEIFRYGEAYSTTIYGREFTSATEKTSKTKDPAQFIKRSGVESDFSDVEGGTLMILPRMKKINIAQDYGCKDSLFKTWEFNYEDFILNLGGWSVIDWLISGEFPIWPVKPRFPELGSKGIYLEGEAGEALTEFIYQNVFNIKSTETDKFNISIEAALLHIGSAEIRKVTVMIRIEGTSTYWYDGEEWTTNSNTFLEKEIILDGMGWSGWETLSYTINSVPISGTLQVRLYAAQSLSGDTNVAFRNIRLQFADQSGRVFTQKQWTVTNASEGSVKSLEYAVGDGPGIDNDVCQYRGAINIFSGSSILPTSLSWHYRGSGDNKPLLELIADEIAFLTSRHRQLIDLPLRETVKDALLDLNGNLQDPLNKYLDRNRIFTVCRGVFDAKRREWSLTIIETGLAGGSVPGSITVDSTEVTVDSTEITVDQN